MTLPNGNTSYWGQRKSHLEAEFWEWVFGFSFRNDGFLSWRGFELISKDATV